MSDFKFKIPRYAQSALMLFLGVALAACSPAKKYQKFNRTTDTLGADVASCQAKASDLMRRELLLDQSYERTKERSRGIICSLRRSQTTSTLLKIASLNGDLNRFSPPKE